MSELLQGDIMKRKTASDYDQELLNLYDRYCHSNLSRREFFDKAAKFAVGGVTVAALLEGLLPNYALPTSICASK
jgi:carboxymethylenebutenolidase